MKTSPKFIPIVILLALIALALGVWFGIDKTSQPAINTAELNMTVFPNPRAVSYFSLIDNKGNTFTQENLKGQWDVLFFGFTSCAHICPPFMRQLAEFYQALESKGHEPLPRVVFVSVDPDRDTPERMNDYVKSFNPNFIGVTGDKAVIDQLANELSVLYFTVNEGRENYDIEHSGTFMFIDPNGHWYGITTPPHDVNTLVEEYQLVSTS